jgi:fucose permease
VVTARTRSIAVLIYGFVLLGMPGSAIGVAWPAIAEDLGRSLGDLGFFTLMAGVGYSVISLSSGRLTKRFPARRLLVASAAAAFLSLFIFAVADSWFWFVVAAIPLGLAGGILDSVGNGFVAITEGSRVMGLIHAAFGLGSMIAPLFMTLLAVLGMSWRVGFITLALLEVVLALGFLVFGSVIRMPMHGSPERPKRGGSKTLLGLSVWVFFIYAGVEGSTGFWAFTLLTEGQGISATVAGFAVAAHWGALFASRLILGMVGDRVEPNRTITVSAAGIVVGLGLLWWNPSSWVSVFGLVLAGFASGPVFPLEILLTPKRFGADFTQWAVGYQLSAATASIAIVPAAIGYAVNRQGPLVIGAMLAALAVVMFLSIEVVRFASRHERSSMSEADAGR